MFHLFHGSCVRVGGVLAFGMLRVISRESVTLFLRLVYEPSETSVEAIARPVKQFLFNSINFHFTKHSREFHILSSVLYTYRKKQNKKKIILPFCFSVIHMKVICL